MKNIKYKETLFIFTLILFLTSKRCLTLNESYYINTIMHNDHTALMLFFYIISYWHWRRKKSLLCNCYFYTQETRCLLQVRRLIGHYYSCVPTQFCSYHFLKVTNGLFWIILNSLQL